METPSPTLQPAQAAKLFLRPQRKDAPPDAVPFEGAERSELEFEGGKLAVWQAGAGPVALVLHGWEGTAADIAPFVPGLLQAGFRVVAPDFPAHGGSDGRITSLFQCARAVAHVAAHVGGAEAVLAHSVGCPVAVEAIRAGGMKPRAVVLVATPARYKDYAMAFGKVAGLDKQGIGQMLEELRNLGVDVAAIDTPAAVKTLDVPALLIHSDDDRVVPQFLGQEVANAWPGAKFMPVTGLGHRKILSAPPVVEAAVAFVREQVQR